MQRLRVSFTREDELKFLSHLDIMKLWERALRRANVPVAYSQGFVQHTRISLAAPLSVGMTSQAELMDVYLSRWLSPPVFKQQVMPQLPRGITLLDVCPVNPDGPSLQAAVRLAEYEVEMENDRDSSAVETAIRALLSTRELPWQHQRDNGVRHYDLRPLIDDIWLIGVQDISYSLGMRLQCSSKGAGRPEQVARALGWQHHPRIIHRTRLILT
jgi:radical SAM-linked protein